MDTLNSLLHDDDSGDDASSSSVGLNSTSISGASGSGGLLAPPVSLSAPMGVSTPIYAPARAAPAPAPAPVAKPVSAGGGEQIIQHMFNLLKKMMHPEAYEKLKLQIQTQKTNKKTVLDLIRSIAGERIYNDVMVQIRQFQNSNNNPSSSVAPKPMMFPTTTNSMATPISTPMTTPRTTPMTTTSSSTTPSSNAATRALKVAGLNEMLQHAAVCKLPNNECQQNRCENIRKLFKHNTVCREQLQCNFCKKLRELVKVHAANCMVVRNIHCPVPLCDGMLQRTLTNPSTSAHNNMMMMRTGSNSTTTPIANKSMVPPPQKASKQASANTPIKMEPMANKMPAKKLPLQNVAAGAALSQQQPQNKAKIFGEILTLILHAQKCVQLNCTLGTKCQESKKLISEMDLPNPNPRASTYKKVYDHYKSCPNRAKCPVCSSKSIPTAVNIANINNKRPLTATPPKNMMMMNKKSRKYSSSSLMMDDDPNSVMGNNNDQQQLPNELIPSSMVDLRREADVLSHVNVDIGDEKSQLLRHHQQARSSLVSWKETLSSSNQNKSKKKSENETGEGFNLLQKGQLHQFLVARLQQKSLLLAPQSLEFFNLAIQDYLKQCLEELVTFSKHRCHENISGTNSLTILPSSNNNNSSTQQQHLHISLTESETILSQLQHEHMTQMGKLKQRDLELRKHLLTVKQSPPSTGMYSGGASKKKLSKKKMLLELQQQQLKQQQDADCNNIELFDREELDMDIEEIAVKDLTQKLIHQEKYTTHSLDGRVLDSVGKRVAQKNQVTMQDAVIWLEKQRPYVKPKAFVRAQAAMIATNLI